MGGSTWDYTVKYEPDVASALEALRRHVFNEGDYYPRSINPDFARHMGINPLQSNPLSIDDLLEMQSDEGTHSILDICGGITSEPEICTASPLSEDQFGVIFATLRPTCDQVQSWMEDCGYDDVRERGSAVYLPCYRDGHPEHLHFGGVSGD